LPSPVHSAHVGQFAVVHYPWHALFGRRVRVERRDNRKTGQYVHVEVLPGLVTVLAAWMLDASACVGMAIGEPRVSIAALADLDDLLKRRNFRRSCPGEIATREEQLDARPKEDVTRAQAVADAAGFDTAAGNEPARSGRRRDPAREPAAGSSQDRSGGAER
jgi:hypothetical protein